MKKVYLSLIIAGMFILSEAKVPESLADQSVIQTSNVNGIRASDNNSLNNKPDEEPDNYRTGKLTALCTEGVNKTLNDDLVAYSDSPKISTSGTEKNIIGYNESLGGYVFYVTPDGNHGLVAATQDQSSSSDWYLAQDVISNPANYNEDGKKFVDWRLPTKFELNIMYTQKADIGAFDDSYYWSSIINGATYAWLKNFGNGSQDYGPKDGNYHVRAVRSF